MNDESGNLISDRSGEKKLTDFHSSRKRNDDQNYHDVMDFMNHYHIHHHQHHHHHFNPHHLPGSLHPHHHAAMTGMSFGITSGVITTLGLMIGLTAGTKSKLAVLGGILTIAIADAFSDSLGIYTSEETKSRTHLHILISMATTFLMKFFTALSFVIPVLLTDLKKAMILSIVWSVFLLSILSTRIAQFTNEPILEVVCEHLISAILVTFFSHYIGNQINSIFQDSTPQSDEEAQIDKKTNKVV